MPTQEYEDTRRFRSIGRNSVIDDRPYRNSEMMIFKFDWMRTNAKDWQYRSRLRRRIYDDCKLMTEFKVKFIDAFSSIRFDDLLVYTSWQNALHRQDPDRYPPKLEYEKSWLLDQYEIGFDLIHKQYGVRNENHWRSWYVLVPKVETEMVSWMLENKPYFVKILSKI